MANYASNETPRYLDKPDLKMAKQQSSYSTTPFSVLNASRIQRKEHITRTDLKLNSPLVYHEMPVAGVSSASHAKFKEQLINVDALKHKRDFNQISANRNNKSPSIEKPVRPFEPQKQMNKMHSVSNLKTDGGAAEKHKLKQVQIDIRAMLDESNSLQTQRERLTTKLNKLSINPKNEEERKEREELESQHSVLTKMINGKKVELKRL